MLALTLGLSVTLHALHAVSFSLTVHPRFSNYTISLPAFSKRVQKHPPAVSKLNIDNSPSIVVA